jgi:hypothetical protein
VPSWERWVRETYLNNLITREGKEGNVCCVAGHEISVENAEYAFVGDDKKIVLFSLQFEDDRLESDGDIVVRLVTLADQHTLDRCQSYFCSGKSVVVRIEVVLEHFIGVIVTDPPL